ncbi:hypothetical protein D3H55_22175 [Bacillus salacetis]|uniref:Uncharacterized protein n=1 Tax=Bacillus salacetis TaxID=2315464 RepID=A0A3A1QML1_9BACI|nr:hypothetical protein [Bacillus salacetis]RIW28211.1 hypothetical protein D3H55_22175 [Bacillus salacetis]
MKTVFGFIDRKFGNSNAFIKVLASVKNDQLIEIEKHIEEFPNNGKVIYYHIPEEVNEGTLGFYTLNESGTFDITSPISSKYAVSTETSSYNYFEIIETNYSFSENKQKLISILQNGITKTHEISSKLVLLTTDDFLIGPCSTKNKAEDKWIAEFNESGLIEVRKNDVNIIKHWDAKYGVERYFISAATINSPIDHYLDCSTNERVVRDALKILKEEKEVSEISRRVIKMLGDLVSETPSQVRKDRVTRASELLINYLVSDEEINRLNNELLRCEAVIEKINEKVGEQLVKAKKKLEEDHKTITNETKQLTSRKDKLQGEIKDLKSNKKQVETDLEKANEALQQKLKEMQENVYHTLVNLLPTPNFPIVKSKATAGVTSIQSSQWFTQENEREIEIGDLVHLIEKLVSNLEQINVEKNDAKFIVFTTLGAILFRKPLIIKGSNSFDIAQTIGWTISGNEHLTIFPDIKGYSNEALVSCFQNYKRLNTLKSLHLSNIENAPTELYMPSFIDYWGVSINSSYPELFMLSVKNIDELSKDLLDKLKYIPIIDTEEINIKGELRNARLEGTFTFGYISIKSVIGNTELTNNKSKVYKDFKDALEEITSMDPRKIKNEFKDWFRLLENASDNEEEITEWVLQTFLRDYMNNEQFKNIADELLVGEMLTL